MIVTFGRFHNLSTEELQKDKELFLEKKRNFASFSFDNIDKSKYKEMEESQIDQIIKEKSTRIKSSYDVQGALHQFLLGIGLGEKVLNDDEKKQILSMNLTYDNCAKFTLNIYNKYIEKAKRECPSEIYVCFEEKAFITYCLHQKEAFIEMTKQNFLSFIKDYFILDKYKEYYGYLRDNKLFNKIRDKMIDIYPILKENYGRKNKIFDKFMRFFEEDNDYNYEFIKEILNNYDKKNKNEYIKLKQNED